MSFDPHDPTPDTTVQRAAETALLAIDRLLSRVALNEIDPLTALARIEVAVGRYTDPDRPPRPDPEPSWTPEAIGAALARKVFDRRGNHSEAHVSEVELGVMLTAAATLARRPS